MPTSTSATSARVPPRAARTTTAGVMTATAYSHGWAAIQRMNGVGGRRTAVACPTRLHPLMLVPDDRRYSEDHEWALVDDGRVRVGITDYAQDALGDVLYVELPEIGTHIEAGATMCEIESTKSVSDVYAPVTGRVAEVNAELAETPGHVNEDPYGDGWICVIEPDDVASVGALMDPEAYRALTA